MLISLFSHLRIRLLVNMTFMEEAMLLLDTQATSTLGALAICEEVLDLKQSRLLLFMMQINFKIKYRIKMFVTTI